MKLDPASWFAQHRNVALQVSGGKDSTACLYLLRDYWDRVTVMWANTGAAMPETVELIAKIREMVPHFIEVKSDQPAQIAQAGLPVDILPVRNCAIGRWIEPNKEARLQSYIECCATNIWAPMARAVTELGATLVIRGQRNSEKRRAPIRSGYTADGVTVWFPIEDWTEAQVWDYLKEQGVSIEHYAYTQTSLDCWSCTAYLDENVGKMRYLKERHPHLWEIQRANLETIRGLIASQLVDVERALYAAA